MQQSFETSTAAAAAASSSSPTPPSLRDARVISFAATTNDRQRADQWLQRHNRYTSSLPVIAEDDTEEASPPTSRRFEALVSAANEAKRQETVATAEMLGIDTEALASVQCRYVNMRGREHGAPTRQFVLYHCSMTGISVLRTPSNQHWRLRAFPSIELCVECDPAANAPQRLWLRHYGVPSDDILVESTTDRRYFYYVVGVLTTWLRTLVETTDFFRPYEPQFRAVLVRPCAQYNGQHLYRSPRLNHLSSRLYLPS